MCAERRTPCLLLPLLGSGNSGAPQTGSAGHRRMGEAGRTAREALPGSVFGTARLGQSYKATHRRGLHPLPRGKLQTPPSETTNHRESPGSDLAFRAPCGVSSPPKSRGFTRVGGFALRGREDLWDLTMQRQPPVLVSECHQHSADMEPFKSHVLSTRFAVCSDDSCAGLGLGFGCRLSTSNSVICNCQ